MFAHKSNTELASELLLGRVKMPAPRHPNCLLARHEAGLFAECQKIFQFARTHRGDEHNRFLLPLSLPLVEAIGHRMVYEAALDAGVHRPLLDLYEAGIVKLDPAWYSESAGVSRVAQREMEDRAVTAAVPHLERYLEETEAADYVRAPMLSKEGRDGLVASLDCYTGAAALQVVDEPVFGGFGETTSVQARARL